MQHREAADPGVEDGDRQVSLGTGHDGQWSQAWRRGAGRQRNRSAGALTSGEGYERGPEAPLAWGRCERARTGSARTAERRAEADASAVPGTLRCSAQA